MVEDWEVCVGKMKGKVQGRNSNLGGRRMEQYTPTDDYLQMGQL